MSWRLEKETDGQQAYVIDGWEKGIAENPYDGINDIRNANIGTVPKEISVGFGITTSTTSGATLGVPISRATAFTSGAATNYYILDTDGHVFNSSTMTGTWTYLSTNVTLTSATQDDGVWAWKGFVFKTRAGNIDYYSAGSWTNGWKTTLTGTTRHFAIIGQDDVVYITNGNNIASLMEVEGATFDPTNTATYIFNIAALGLPSTDISLSLAELGTNLLIGGSQNAIYPWDRISPLFSYPIFCADTYINKMVTANNNVFIFPGNVTGRGRIYITNGSQVELYVKMPDMISGYQEPYYKFYDAIYHRNSIVFGCEVTKNEDGSVITSPTAEVWAFDCTTKALRGISDITGGSASARVLIPNQSNAAAKGYAYIVGYSNGSVHGIGYSGTTAGIGTASFKTDQIPVGTFLNKKTISQIEIVLSYPLQSGESVLLTWSSDNGVASGTLATFTSTTTTVGNYSAVNFEKSEWLQLQGTLTGNSAISGCRLREIRLR